MILKVIFVLILTSIGICSSEIDSSCFELLKMDIDECCVLPIIIPTKIMNKCLLNTKTGSLLEDIDSEDPYVVAFNSFEPKNAYYSQCHFTEIGALQNSFNLTLAENVMNTTVKDKEWKPHVMTAAYLCKTEYEQLNDDFPKTSRYGPFFYELCMKTKLFANCPLSHWEDEDGCSKIKADATKCPFIMIEA